MRFMPLHGITRHQVPFTRYRQLFGRATFSRQHPPLAHSGDLELHLTRRLLDIRAAQRLRYQVFYEELGARANARTRRTRRDADRFDRHCDHLVVIDRAARASDGNRQPRLVGTYRLQSRLADEADRFYSAGEYDLAPLLARHRGSNFLELGRSCVLPSHRGKRTIELLWHGILAVVNERKCDVLIGCASLPGTDPDRLALPLSFLHHHARADETWQVAALPRQHIAMNRMAKRDIDARAALAALPPLLRGYLRLGAKVGDGAVIDAQFNTTDVFVVLPVERIDARYLAHFSPARQAT